MNFTDQLFDKLESIAAVSGKKDKLTLIATFTPEEREIVRWALDPTVTFYIAKLAATETTGADGWGLAEQALLADLSQRRLTGHAALDQVKFSLRELTHKSGELLRRVILKDLRAGFGASSVNKVFPGLVPEFAYMRCSLPKDVKLENWPWERGVYSQLKANGMFARADVTGDGEVTITTRQGNTFPAGSLEALETVLGKAFSVVQLHGELTVVRQGATLPRSEGNGMLNALMEGTPLPGDVAVVYDLWDVVPLSEAVVGGKSSEPYSARWANLMQSVGQFSADCGPGVGYIKLIETRGVRSLAEAQAHARELMSQGLEGTVVKHPDALWKDGDSREQVKFKLEVDVDLKIIGFNPGTPGTRTESTFGSVRCATADDLLVVDVAGFKRDLEQYLHENRDSVLGKIMCVRANEVSPPCDTNPLHSLYHPRVVELRKDKAEADCLQMVLAQFESAVTA